jgi:hypothetical protein
MTVITFLIDFHFYRFILLVYRKQKYKNTFNLQVIFIINFILQVKKYNLLSLQEEKVTANGNKI